MMVTTDLSGSGCGQGLSSCTEVACVKDRCSSMGVCVRVRACACVVSTLCEVESLRWLSSPCFNDLICSPAER